MLTLKKVEKITVPFLSKYYRNIFHAAEKNQIIPKPRNPLLYPSVLLISQTPHHIILEIIGHREECSSDLKVCSRKIKSTDSYFDQFSDGSEAPAMVVDIGNGGIILDNLIFCRNGDDSKIVARFPILKGFTQNYRLQKNGIGTLLKIGPNQEKLIIKNCKFINLKDGAYRLKSVFFCLVIKKDLHTNNLTKILKNEFKDTKPAGVISVSNKITKSLLISTQLQSLYLSPTVHETTIGQFFKKHPEILFNSLNYKDLIYEANLEWVEYDSNVKPKNINPDMFLKRSDGYYDILDFKTALLKKKNLTNSKVERRLFIYYVYDGISQLYTYLKYFDSLKNTKYAYDKYKIKIKNPNLILVTGSMENFKKENIEQASYNHKPITIIDYDTIVNLYIRKNGFR